MKSQVVTGKGAVLVGLRLYWYCLESGWVRPSRGN